MIMKAFSKILLLALLWFDAVPKAKALPPGFEDRTLVAGLNLPLDFVFTPKNEMLVATKAGEVIVFTDPDGDYSYSTRTTALDLSTTGKMCDNGERGIGGMTIHPDFDVNNRWIYLFYTFNKKNSCAEDANIGPVNRLSRFVLSENNVIDPASELVFFDTPSLEFDHHNSGCLAFGNDGYLYVSVGDGGSTWSRVSENPANLFGSMIRLTDDGGIPTDNPYTFQSGEFNSVRCNVDGVPPPGSPPGAKCQEIFHIGLRNPYRFAIDPNVADKTRLYINDVGQGLWESVKEGGTDFAGANYGWPDREGPCPTNRAENCGDAHPNVDPIHWYAHEFIGGWPQGAATASAFIPDGVWPNEFDGGYLYADYTFGNIYFMSDKPTGPPCRQCNPPVSNQIIVQFTAFEQIVNMEFGPYRDTQALYYSGINEIRRVVYVGDGNRSPDAVILVSPGRDVPVGATVQFSGAGSSDKNGDQLSFEWDFNGDGAIDSVNAVASYTFYTAGLYEASLTVNDGKGGKHTVTVEISVGEKPVPVITSPAEGDTFAVGDFLTLLGAALDGDGTQLPASALTWEVRQHHADHYHPFLNPTEGNDITLEQATPAPEDYEAATNSYLEILLTATDATGLSTTVTRNVQPRKLLVDFATDPSGLELFLDGTRLATPEAATTWEGHGLRVEAPDQLLNGQAYVFSSWTDGSTVQSRVIDIPPASDTALTYVAQFVEGTFAPTAAPTPTEVCAVGSLGVSTSGSDIVSGQVIVNAEFEVFLEQQANGNLVVTTGTPANPGDLVWESGANGDSGEYFTRVLGNSNLVTYAGNPGFVGPMLWQTGTLDVDINLEYFLGIDCNLEHVSVYQGLPDNPTNIVWSCCGTPPPLRPADPRPPVTDGVVDCGCQTQCTAAVLDQDATDAIGTYTCRSRINYVVATFEQTEQEACATVSNEFPAICGQGCNPPSCVPVALEATDCGCGAQCTASMLDQIATDSDGSLTCRERINTLMSTLDQTELQACETVSNEFPSICGQGCNPPSCIPMDEEVTDCGCGAQCTALVLDRLATDDDGFSFTCRNRINWVILNMNQTEPEACAAVAQQFPKICGPDCDPDQCDDAPPTSAPQTQSPTIAPETYPPTGSPIEATVAPVVGTLEPTISQEPTSAPLASIGTSSAPVVAATTSKPTSAPAQDETTSAPNSFNTITDDGSTSSDLAWTSIFGLGLQFVLLHLLL